VQLLLSDNKIDLSYMPFQKAFQYGELLLNEMWRKYVRGNLTTKNELIDNLVDLFTKLQRFELFIMLYFEYS